MKLTITVSDELKEVAPEFRGAAIIAQVQNSPFSESLWTEINRVSQELKEELTIPEIKNLSTIAATRTVYKRCKKDPNRYRPAAEALRRRIVKGEALYQIDTLVDLVNLVSIVTGYSMGGFDAAQIKGSSLVLGIGKADEVFHGIGRGPLNIEGLPVYRDKLGGIGTPTSDEERTKMSVDTTELLILINGYSGEEGLQEAVSYTIDLLEKYVDAQEVKYVLYS
ncbi:B3/B4 domain-containing protein [Bacteroides propionicifaciens]|uniref:B3/B4 domain-containing protein n=1 Tax=Bacteroides propionicifaciens TaxID=392838 RepID=UPI00037DD610|nr:phenylalanine--tRNA ligase beta subunit-related protein [Bacteroides propionicifaciens]